MVENRLTKRLKANQYFLYERVKLLTTTKYYRYDGVSLLNAAECYLYNRVKINVIIDDTLTVSSRVKLLNIACMVE